MVAGSFAQEMKVSHKWERKKKKEEAEEEQR